MSAPDKLDALWARREALAAVYRPLRARLVAGDAPEGYDALCEAETAAYRPLRALDDRLLDLPARNAADIARLAQVMRTHTCPDDGPFRKDDYLRFLDRVSDFAARAAA